MKRLRRVDGDCYIEDIFPFRGVLFVRGSVGLRSRLAPLIYLADDSDELRACEYSSDPQWPEEGDCKFQFHLPLKEPLTTEYFRTLQLVFIYPDGWFSRGQLDRDQIAKDKFLASEGEFWAAVQANRKASVLEIGSRARSGISRRHLFPKECAYVGLDLQPGPNVDVVCDAHVMSSVLGKGKFDFAFSVSTWEHLHSPWRVSLELNRVLKVGGLVMINTHQTWPYHDGPWDYFRFSDGTWDALFNEKTGFEVLARGMGLKSVVCPAVFNSSLEPGMERHYGYLAVRCVARKTHECIWDWPIPTGKFGQYTY